MTQLPPHAPVVVIGAGPTGLCVANLLASYGVTPLVLDRAAGPLNLPRAIVLDDEGARTLQAFGLHDRYLAKARPAIGSAYYDDAGVCFARTGAGVEVYGFAKRSFIHQPDLEADLRARLHEQAPDALHWGCEVVGYQEGRLHVKTDSGTQQITADWILACDGGRSPMRERLGIAMSGRTYAQDWIVIDMAEDPDQDPFSKFHCRSDRPQLTVPAPNGGRRYEFMMLPGETPEAVLHPDVIAELLHPYRGAVDPAHILRKTVYTFHARLAEQFRQGRVILLGDAAHLTPPFAGQGMNAGLRDACNVAWKVAAILRGGASDGVLDSYQAERHGPAWDMILLAVAMGDIVMPIDPDALAFRGLLLQALAPFPAVRDYLIQMRFKPRPRYAQGLFLGLGTPEFEGDLTGEMAPQPKLVGGGRLDDLLGAGFALVAQDQAGAGALAGLDVAALGGLPLARVVLGTDPSAPAHWPQAESGPACRMLRSHRDRILLLRPDRYCAASFAPDALDAGVAAYARLLQSPLAQSPRQV